MLRSLLIASAAALAAYGAAPDDGSVPLFFISNQGQAPSSVRFMAQGSGLTAYFSPDEVLFRSGDAAVRLEFAGANPAPRVEGVGPLEARAHFLTGSQAEWRADVPLYRAVAYRELYPAIDMVYGSDGRNLKSEFLVAPGGDPSRIRLRYRGAGEVRVDESGALVISAAGREWREQAPVIYQQAGGRRVDIGGRYLTAPDGIVSFIVNRYDRSLPLVIDPTLSYSTLMGGASSDAATALAVDSAGAAYVAGFTASYDLPMSNPEQGFNAGGNDVFVAKLNAAGNALVYCTYIGGKADDRAYGIAVDSTGAAYITGSTTSTNFPVRLALQSKLAGAKNAFVLKLSPAGNTLVFSTYLGGGGSDIGNGIAIDSGKNVYVVGDSTSVNFPASAFQKGRAGGQDAFIAKLSADGSRLVYSTYLGGTGDDHGAAIALDASGDAYVTGSTWSGNFPLASAYQARLAGGQDAFVAKLAADGNSLLFSTYLGGTGGSLGYAESGQGIAVDAQGSAYVAGVTASGDFPLLHAFQISRLGWTDAFVAKLSSSGALVYSTYLGGTGLETANGIAVDAAGMAYVAGQTFSSDLPVFNALQGSRIGDYEAFWARISASGDSLLALSYLGGTGADTATAAALDQAGNLYIAGWTLSTNFPLQGAFQSTNAGNYGAFVAKIVLGPAISVMGVTPNAGSGTSQMFRIQISDTGGAADLTAVSVLINSSLSTTNACAVAYVPASNTLILLTDSGASPSGTITPGSGSQQNSQCTLNGSDSSVSISGTVLTLDLALAFKPAFTGSKTFYAQARNNSSTTGWQQAGTWTVPSTAPPVAVSVSPSSGTSASQTFTFVFSNPRGYASVTSTQILINAGASMSGGCYLFFNRAANTVYLTNDEGTAWQTPVGLGQAGTLQNSQCSVNPAGSSASGSGDTLTLNLAIAFQPAFAGAKDVYMEVNDASVPADSGWVKLGAWTVPGSGPPAPVSVTPSSGSGAGGTFSFVYSHPQGAAAILSAQILVNSSMAMSNACYLLFNRAANAVYLTNDAGTAWQAPVTLGQSGTLQNSQCSVDAATSSASASGTTLTLNLALTFKPAFAGSRNLYMEVFDGALDSGWQQRGSWTVPSGGPPSTVSVTPNSGSGSTQPFSFTFSDPSGNTAIVSTQMLVNSSMSMASGCYLLYYRPNNTIYLTNDEGTAWQAPVALGQSGTLQNSQCTVNTAASSASGSGNTLTVNISLTFKPAFSGTKNLYLEAYNGSGDSGWQQRGSWTVL